MHLPPTKPLSAPTQTQLPRHQHPLSPLCSICVHPKNLRFPQPSLTHAPRALSTNPLSRFPSRLLNKNSFVSIRAIRGSEPRPKSRRALSSYPKWHGHPACDLSRQRHRRGLSHCPPMGSCCQSRWFGYCEREAVISIEYQAVKRKDTRRTPRLQMDIPPDIAK